MTFAPSYQFETSPAAGAARPLLALGACVGLAMGVVGLRSSIVAAAPGAASLFAAAGLPVNLAGMDIDRVSARIVLDDDRKVLVVEGDVVNTSDRARAPAPMVVSVLGSDGQTIYTWTTRAPRQTVAPGERAVFVARLASPPGEASQVRVEFDRFAKASQSAPAKRQNQGSSTESQ